MSAASYRLWADRRGGGPRVRVTTSYMATMNARTLNPARHRLWLSGLSLSDAERELRVRLYRLGLDELRYRGVGP